MRQHSMNSHEGHRDKQRLLAVIATLLPLFAESDVVGIPRDMASDHIPAGPDAH